MDFISQNSHRHIGQDNVSRAVGAGTRTLQLRFRKVLNRPIATEIRRVRIERAKREPAHSDRRLSDIARDAGFGKSMRMYEVFRREPGITPSEYRTNNEDWVRSIEVRIVLCYWANKTVQIFREIFCEARKNTGPILVSFCPVVISIGASYVS